MSSAKILITGNAGSGKMTLAEELSQNLRIDKFGLDKSFGSQDGKKHL